MIHDEILKFFVLGGFMKVLKKIAALVIMAITMLTKLSNFLCK